MISSGNEPGVTEALRHWSGKKILPTEFGSEDLRALSSEFRRRNIFTARGTNAEFVQEIDNILKDTRPRKGKA